MSDIYASLPPLLLLSGISILLGTFLFAWYTRLVWHPDPSTPLAPPALPIVLYSVCKLSLFIGIWMVSGLCWRGLHEVWQGFVDGFTVHSLRSPLAVRVSLPPPRRVLVA